jgi:hypothetical protein
MSAIDRRSVLTSAVLGTAALVGATALGSVAPEAAHAHGSLGLDESVPDPNFAEGRVAAISGSLLTVTGSDLVLHRIRATGATSIWKLHPTSFNAVEVGDGLYARGVPLPDGTLAADAVWVNIVNVHAEILSIGRTALGLAHRGHDLVGHVVPGVTTAVYNQTAAVADLSGLRVGSHIQVVGAWRPDTHEVDIATIYARR